MTNAQIIILVVVVVVALIAILAVSRTGGPRVTVIETKPNDDKGGDA